MFLGKLPRASYSTPFKPFFCIVHRVSLESNEIDVSKEKEMKIKSNCLGAIFFFFILVANNEGNAVANEWISGLLN